MIDHAIFTLYSLLEGPLYLNGWTLTVHITIFLHENYFSLQVTNYLANI